MKQYIYITPEGTINWIEKMPKKPSPPDSESEVRHSDGSKSTLCLGGDFGYSNALRKYNEAIERAKAESIPFDDKKYISNKISEQWSFGGNEFFLQPNVIYPIELDTDIQIVEVPEYPGFDHTSYPTFKKVAKIIPKKAEESEDPLYVAIDFNDNDWSMTCNCPDEDDEMSIVISSPDGEKSVFTFNLDDAERLGDFLLRHVKNARESNK